MAKEINIEKEFKQLAEKLKVASTAYCLMAKGKEMFYFSEAALTNWDAMAMVTQLRITADKMEQKIKTDTQQEHQEQKEENYIG